jgi:hypothetical protein
MRMKIRLQFACLWREYVFMRYKSFLCINMVMGCLLVAPATDLMAEVLPVSGGSQTNFYSVGGSRWAAHVFTQNGTLVVSKSVDVEYLIVAGGGGGASTVNNIDRAGGGGGAGGLLQGSTNLFPLTTNVVVGAGGSGGVNGAGSNGGNSSAFGLTAIGGGGGSNAGTTAGKSGGSGGGGGNSNPTPPAGGSGTPGQGNAGATGSAGTRGGGGGGAGTAGVLMTGGAGLTNSITGSVVTYAAGGNGGSTAARVSATPAAADANTGNGGLGISPSVINGYNGGAGGSGIVVIKYELPPLGTVIYFR